MIARVIFIFTAWSFFAFDDDDEQIDRIQLKQQRVQGVPLNFIVRCIWRGIHPTGRESKFFKATKESKFR